MMRFLLIFSSSLFLTACISPNTGGKFLPGDGLPKGAKIDIASVPDAVPKRERLSETGNRPYTVFNKAYTPLKSGMGYRKEGIASWYGTKFHGRRASGGEPYDMYAMSAAHRTLPLPSYARVTNLSNKRSVIVKINDRGPFIDPARRILDLSYTAAAKLGIVATGTARVRVEAIDAQALIGQVSLRPQGNQAITSAMPLNNELVAKTLPILKRKQSAYEPKVKKTLEKKDIQNTLQTGNSYLQMGAFSLRENAEKLVFRLRRIAVDAFIDIKDGLYKVKSGPFDNIDFALQTKLQIDRQLDIEARVVFE